MGELELGLRLAGALVRFWSARGLMAEVAAGSRARRAARGDVDPTVRAKALFAAGYAALGLGDFVDARARFETCLALARDSTTSGGRPPRSPPARLDLESDG